MTAIETLNTFWGFDEFRTGQAQVIESVLAERDTLAVLPTGGGKSLCYQVPALMLPGLTIVISPLVALMADQVQALERRKIPATFLNSTLTRRDEESRWNGLTHARFRLVYVAPETLLSERFLLRAQALNVSLIAVDEAHCVSTWGHDFRPAYRRIPEAYPVLGHPPVVALTATATPPVRRDVVKGLGLRKPQTLVYGFDRPNLVWSVFSGPGREARLASVLEAVPGAGIAYAGTRRGSARWAAMLRSKGHTAKAYHAGLPSTERTKVQKAWTAGSVRVMVATSAFGMGIDRSDIRFVVHLEPPPSLEAYYQEAGRAGRDGKRAYAVLLTDVGDEKDLIARIDARYPAVKRVRRVYEVVCDLARLAVGSMPDHPVAVDPTRVAAVVGTRTGEIVRCLELLEHQGVWRLLPAREGQGMIRFRNAPETWSVDGALAEWADAVLRSVSSEAMHAAQWVDPVKLAKRMESTVDQAETALSRLAERELIQWIAPTNVHLLAFAGPRSARPPVDAAALRESRSRARTHARDMARYADSPDCRRRALLAYFGESGPATCGRCDRCMGRHERHVVTPVDEPALKIVWQAVRDGIDPVKATGLEAYPPYRREELVDYLLIEGYLCREGTKLAATERAWPEN